MKKILLGGLTIFLTLFMTVCICCAATYNIKFSWDKNTEPDLKGYRLYKRIVSGEYTDDGSLVMNIEDISADTYTISEFQATEATYFVLTAYDTNYNESGYSNEVHVDVDNEAPAAPNITITVTVEIKFKGN